MEKRKKKRPKLQKKQQSRTRTQRPFPTCPFEEALEFAAAIQKYASGQPIRRLTLFDQLNKSPDSGPSRQLIINSNKYGLTKGSYSAEQIELTPDGATATSDEATVRERTRARVKLAIQDLSVFNSVYERFVNTKLPARSVLGDMMKDLGVSDSLVQEALDTFIVNAQFVGLLKTLSGAERFVTVDHLLDSLPTSSEEKAREAVSSEEKVREAGELGELPEDRALITKSEADFATLCFYITPIGEDGTETRKHSDLFLGSIVEPSLEQFSLQVVRADAIDKPGVITRQIIEYLLKARLVIADLSFHNPNVFYELAIRHAARLPTVQIIRTQDRIPFDLNQIRTVKIDDSNIYSLVPKIETYRSEIASQVRRALDDPDTTDNPITTFWPGFKVEL